MAGVRGIKLVRGVGINDADYETQKFLRVDGKYKSVWLCPYYNKWSHMLLRCYNKKVHEKRPTYIGCSVCDEWLYFSKFKSWMEKQDWESKELDKDLLVKGNKIYSPESCAFINQVTNKFISENENARGELPLGVHLHKPLMKFIAKCCNPTTGKREHLGVFICPQEAHKAWRKRKHELACKLADMQDDPRVAEALRKRYI